MSMTRRLMWSLTGATILFWIATSGLGAYVMRDEFDEVFDSALQETAQRLVPLVINDLFQREDSSATWRVDGGSAREEEYLTYQVRDLKGTVVMHSHDAQVEPFDAPLRRGFFDTPAFRIYTEPAVSGTLFLQVADRYDHRREATVEGVTSLLVPIILLAPLSMLTIWFLVRRSLAPLGSMRREIGARNGANLSPVAVGGMPAELETIAVSVNRLLERLRTALLAEREFASNSAHELRTPIAGALAQTQMLISELPAGRERERASDIEASLRSLGHLAEKLLQLARADAGIGASSDPVEIVPIVRLVVEEFSRRPANTDRLALAFDKIGDGATPKRKVDVDALGIIVRNLIENALLHGPEGELVTITIGHDASISVVNAGSVLTPAQLRESKIRFKRGGSSPGSGLGLSIADTLAQQMGAHLDISSPATGKQDGFEARVSWQLAVD